MKSVCSFLPLLPISHFFNHDTCEVLIICIPLEDLVEYHLVEGDETKIIYLQMIFFFIFQFIVYVHHWFTTLKAEHSFN